jgi:hypothetical protein
MAGFIDFVRKYCSLIKNPCTMKKRILNKEVTVKGPSFLGFDSSLTFLPTENPGWFLRTRKGDVPIDFRIAYSKKGRIQLKTNGTTLEVVEHILALKMLVGLDNVILIPHEKWPPYLGGAGGYYEQLEANLRDFPSEFRFSYISMWTSGVYFGDKKNHGAWMKQSTKLEIYVESEWKPMEKVSFIITEETLSSPDFVKSVLNAKPQGFPHNRKWIAKTLSFFGWPNMKYVSWMNNGQNKSDVAMEWCLHAIQDTFGALALCHNENLPMVYYHRVCAGHKVDLDCVKHSFCLVS